MMKRVLVAALLAAGLLLGSANAANIPQQVMTLTTGAVWNSSTSLNATQVIYSGNGSQGPNEVIVQTDTTTTITGGAVTFESTFDGTNWTAVSASQVLDPTSASLAQISIPYTLVANTNKSFAVLTNGAQGVRIKLSTQISGTGTLTPYFAVQPAATGVRQIVALSPTAANFNVTSNLASGSNTIGKVDILGNAGGTLDGTAGSPSTGVLTVQGVASGTPVPVSQSCLGNITTTTPINNAGASTNLKLISKVIGKNVYICAINVGPVAAAVNVALVEGTKTTNDCDTSTAGMAGGSTAATGWQFAANGGLTYGNGAAQLYVTASTGHDVCLLFSAGVQVSGAVTWAQF